MNVLDAPQSTSADAPLGDSTSGEKPGNNSDENVAPSTANPPSPGPVQPLPASTDTRALVRLVQCPQCSYPLQTPVTLPCGNSICRDCLPSSHLRANVSYPDTPDRQSAVTCPFPQCRQAHPLDDCSSNVALYKVMDAINKALDKPEPEADDIQTSMEEVLVWNERSDVPESSDQMEREKGHSRILPGGRLIATYKFAQMGELHYTSDIVYHSNTPEGAKQDVSDDVATMDRLREVCLKELECHVCYNVMLDPLSAPCGHTFCRKCLARILDHSTLCPHCRRLLPLPRSLANQRSNRVLVELLSSLCPELIASRAEAVEQEERSAPGGMDVRLFVCTVSCPLMPTYLHIFEPRYRLMVRRALEGNRQFGMLAYNEYHTPQGDLGPIQFMQYGVMLHIDQHVNMPDGRSFLSCRGLSRFKVVAHDVLDGYVIGKVEPHDDISLAEEERLEAEETSAAPTDDSTPDPIAQVQYLPTRELLQIGRNFVQRAEEGSARWLRRDILAIYGGPPDDPAVFPYWFASVAPLPDEEKYRLIPTTSVRERLKITAQWIRRIEAQRW